MKLMLILAGMLLLSGSAYSAEKVRIPQAERLRPLSFPGKSGMYALGGEFAFDTRKDSLFLIGLSLTEFQFTHLRLGNTVTMSVLPPVITWHLLQKTVTVENEYLINGPNMALSAGIFRGGYAYSKASGSLLILDYGVQCRTKSLYGTKSWVYSDWFGLLDLNLLWTTRLTLGTGYQVNDIVSLIASVDAERWQYGVSKTRPDKVHTGIKIPLDIKLNLTKLTGMMFRIGYATRTSGTSTYWLKGVLVGWQYSSN